MKTEIRMKIESGFLLKEAELTRIKESQNDQIKKLSGQDANFQFAVKYANGALSQPTDIQTIFSEENYGSSKITRVDVKSISTLAPDNFIQVIFNDATRENNSDQPPMLLHIQSDDKDWALVSSSIIEERMQKVRSGKVISYVLSGSFMQVVFYVLLLASIVGTIVPTAFQSSGRRKAITALYESNISLREYMYKVDVMEASYREAMDRYLPYMMVAVTIFGLFAVIFGKSLFKAMPKYVFYWGDMIQRYDKRVSITKFILSAVVLAVIVGIVVNFISEKIF